MGILMVFTRVLWLLSLAFRAFKALRELAKSPKKA